MHFPYSKLFYGLICIFSLSQFTAMGQTDRGKQLFRLCQGCHGAQGEGNVKLKAPHIAGMDQWYLEVQLTKFKTGVRGKHPKDEPGLRMRPMARTLSDEDIKLVSVYVHQLPKQPLVHTSNGHGAKGEELYGVCSSCHGADGKGNEALKAPSLLHMNDWYLVEQLQKFRNGTRANDPALDPMGFGMASIAKTLTNDEAVRDVVDYILALQGERGGK